MSVYAFFLFVAIQSFSSSSFRRLTNIIYVQVSGAIGLLKSRDPTLTGQQAKAFIVKNVNPSERLEGKHVPASVIGK